jgi:hypothetical protein
MYDRFGVLQPFQSGYLMDISRCIERLGIAQKSQSPTINFFQLIFQSLYRCLL